MDLYHYPWHLYRFSPNTLVQSPDVTISVFTIRAQILTIGECLHLRHPQPFNISSAPALGSYVLPWA